MNRFIKIFYIRLNLKVIYENELSFSVLIGEFDNTQQNIIHVMGTTLNEQCIITIFKL